MNWKLGYHSRRKIKVPTSTVAIFCHTKLPRSRIVAGSIPKKLQTTGKFCTYIRFKNIGKYLYKISPVMYYGQWSKLNKMLKHLNIIKTTSVIHYILITIKSQTQSLLTPNKKGNDIQCVMLYHYHTLIKTKQSIKTTIKILVK